MLEKKRKHLFICGGYPSLDGKIKYRGIFSHRSIKSVEKFFFTKVIKVSGFFPFRKAKEEYEYDGVKVKKISTIILPPFKKNPLLTKFFIRYSNDRLKEELEWADFIHIGSSYPVGILAQELMIKSKIKKPIVADVIGSDALIYLSSIYNKNKVWVKEYLKNYDLFFCASNFLKNVMISFGVEEGKLVVAYKGVNSEIFKPTNMKKNINKVRFLYLGGFEGDSLFYPFNLRMKGGDILLDAWEIFEKSDPNAILILAGLNVNGKKIKNFLSRLKYPSKIEIKSEYAVDPSVMPSLYNDADFLVVPSISEGLPNVVLEAQSCGMPVITTDVGGIPEAVDCGASGIVVKAGSVEEIVRGFNWAMENINNYQLFSNRAREFVLNKFSWENYSLSFIKVINRILK